MKILLFAQLAELAGAREITVTGMHDTDALVAFLSTSYEGLAAACYLIAVDKELIHHNTRLHGDAVVALLPPYSGG